MRYRDPVFEQVDRTADIVYGQAMDIPSAQVVDLRLDLYEPRGDTETARPVMVFVHGGGFVGGDKSAGRRYAEEFARRGYVASSIGYRLRQGDVFTVGVPAAVSDARQAVRWFRRYAADLRVDADRITIGGSSAGAITALFVTYTDMERGTETPSSSTAAVMDLWGGLYTYIDEMTAGEPPLVIVHGTEDTVVPFEQATSLKARAEAVGVAYDYHPLAGVGHGSPNAAEHAQWTAEFFYGQLWPDDPPLATASPGASATDAASPTVTATTLPLPTDLPHHALYIPVVVAVGRSGRPTVAPATATAGASPATPTPTVTAGAAFEPPDGLVYHGTSPNPADVDAYVDALAGPAILPLVEGVHMGIPGTRPQAFERNLKAFLDRVAAAGRVPHLSFSFSIGDGQPVEDVIADSDTYDAQIDAAARITAGVPGPVLVRPGFEFNGSWNKYSPGVYPRAFRKFVDRFRAAGAANAVFIWCYEPDAPADFADENEGQPLWYPGDAHVDWFGLDLFDAGHFDPDVPLEDRRGLTPRGRSEAFLAMARDRGKPVYLSEVASVKIGISPDPVDGEGDWQAWFDPWFRFLDAHPEIKGFNLMSQDYRGTRYDADFGWDNARIQDNPVILERWRARMAEPRFLHRQPQP